MSKTTRKSIFRQAINEQNNTGKSSPFIEPEYDFNKNLTFFNPPVKVNKDKLDTFLSTTSSQYIPPSKIIQDKVEEKYEPVPLTHINDISSVKFGIFSAEEILKLSVCQVNSSKICGPNTIYDERMGMIEDNSICITCSQSSRDCPGHFGHIELNAPIIHPRYYKYIILFLRCFCYKCCKLLMNREQIELNGFMKYNREFRMMSILKKVEKIELCGDCQIFQPKYTYSTQDNNIYMSYKKDKETLKIPMTVEEIKRIFDSISIEDVNLLGFNHLDTHPKDLILTHLLVIPPTSRPYIVVDGITCDDDLSIQYMEIVKINNHIKENKENKDKAISEAVLQKNIQALKFRITTLMDNSQGKAKHTNGRPVKAFKERIQGKDGLMRNNLMGKRVNCSGRTVISPDPTLKMGEIAVPEKMANNLTVSERVCNYNIEMLNKIISEDKANFVLREDSNRTISRINLKYATYRKGTELQEEDVILRNGKELMYKCKNLSLMIGDEIIRNGKKLENVIYPVKKQFNLKIGDIVERQLKEGDIIVLNRQPTLHKGSMMGHNVVIRPCKTLRFNLCSTRIFNADFDGDEMNIHVAVSPQSRSEIELLSHTRNHIISPQSSKPAILIVQDSLLALFLLTRENEIMTKDQFFNICMSIPDYKNYAYLDDNKNLKYFLTNILERLSEIENILKAENAMEQNIYQGRNLISLILPRTFNLTVTNNASDNEPVLKIKKGVIISGAMNKSSNSIIQNLHKEYGVSVSSFFIDSIQFMMNAWFIYRGFSIGISDCIISPQNTEKINSAIKMRFIEASHIDETTLHPGIKEARINVALGKARDVGMKMAKDAMSEAAKNKKTLEGMNNFITVITSGSKGDFFNITQITGLLGQQNIKGKRIEMTLNKGTRTLHHYPFQITSKEQEFESRGFISSSFLSGLNMQEFWFHAATGRDGITATAMKTAFTGYVQRKMIKSMEDVQVRYDGTVRWENNNIIQFLYGDDGLDPSETVIIGGKNRICDVSRIVDKLNTEYELQNKI